MKNFRYKKYIPNELGKIVFFEDLFLKKVLKQQFFSNLFSLFFSIFVDLKVIFGNFSTPKSSSAFKCSSLFFFFLLI